MLSTMFLLTVWQPINGRLWLKHILLQPEMEIFTPTSSSAPNPSFSPPLLPSLLFIRPMAHPHHHPLLPPKSSQHRNSHSSAPCLLPHLQHLPLPAAAEPHHYHLLCREPRTSSAHWPSFATHPLLPLLLGWCSPGHRSKIEKHKESIIWCFLDNLFSYECMTW